MPEEEEEKEKQSKLTNRGCPQLHLGSWGNVPGESEFETATSAEGS